MRVLDLFSGIGGFSLGLESAGMETVAFCEQDKFCQKVLAHHWPTLPIHSDITELNGYEYRGSVELVCGGFPCQPFSVAGKQLGKEDDRALWPEMLRVIREVAPRWVIGENVSGIIPMELDQVLSDLEGEGYTCWTFVLPACAVDAHHRRDRVWIVAYSDSNSEPDVAINAETPRQLVAHSQCRTRREGDISKNGDQSDERGEATQRREHPERSGVNGETMAHPYGPHQQRSRLSSRIQAKDDDPNSDSTFSRSRNVANPSSKRRQGQGQFVNTSDKKTPGEGEATEPFDGSKQCFWQPEPDVGRVANGVPNRSHRLKALGNAVVPPLVAEIGRIVMEFENA